MFRDERVAGGQIKPTHYTSTHLYQFYLTIYSTKFQDKNYINNSVT